MFCEAIVVPTTGCAMNTAPRAVGLVEAAAAPQKQQQMTMETGMTTTTMTATIITAMIHPATAFAISVVEQSLAHVSLESQHSNGAQLLS